MVTERNRNTETETNETLKVTLHPVSHIMVDDETDMIGDEDGDEWR